MKWEVVCGDFRDFDCPEEATLVLVDPPYGIGKNYDGQPDKKPFHEWVLDILAWSRAPRTMIFGPHPTMWDWIPKTPQPQRILWWHRTFNLPRKHLRGWLDTMTPILVYESQEAQWYGPTITERWAHNCIDAHCSLADNFALRKARQDKIYPKHPSITGTQIIKKILPFIVQPGDLVVDPMCGAGSVLVAALRCGCDTWGCEINSEWAELSSRWCEYEMTRKEKG